MNNFDENVIMNEYIEEFWKEYYKLSCYDKHKVIDKLMEDVEKLITKEQYINNS